MLPVDITILLTGGCYIPDGKKQTATTMPVITGCLAGITW